MWGIDLSFRMFQFSTVVFLLAAGAVAIGFYLFLEASKVLTVTAEEIVVQTSIKRQVYHQDAVAGFVNIQLPTTKRRKTRQLTILIPPEGRIRIHSDGLGATYDTIAEMLERFGYPELTKSKASQFLDDHKTTYRKIGIVACIVVVVWALNRICDILLLTLRQTGDPTFDWHHLLMWSCLLVLSLSGAIYYAFFSKGYD